MTIKRQVLNEKHKQKNGQDVTGKIDKRRLVFPCYNNIHFCVAIFLKLMMLRMKKDSQFIHHNKTQQKEQHQSRLSLWLTPCYPLRIEPGMSSRSFFVSFFHTEIVSFEAKVPTQQDSEIPCCNCEI